MASQCKGSFDDLVGVPFLEGGRDPAVGVDCLGIVLLGLHRLGIEAEDPWSALKTEWHRGWRPRDLDVPVGWATVKVGAPMQPGDVLGYGPGSTVDHVALLLPAGLVLQSTKQSGSVLFPITRLRSRILEVWRWQP